MLDTREYGRGVRLAGAVGVGGRGGRLVGGVVVDVDVGGRGGGPYDRDSRRGTNLSTSRTCLIWCGF